MYANNKNTRKEIHMQLFVSFAGGKIKLHSKASGPTFTEASEGARERVRAVLEQAPKAWKYVEKFDNGRLNLYHGNQYAEQIKVALGGGVVQAPAQPQTENKVPSGRMTKSGKIDLRTKEGRALKAKEQAEAQTAATNGNTQEREAVIQKALELGLVLA